MRSRSGHLLFMGLLFEGGLIVAAVALNEWMKHPPFAGLVWSVKDAALGAAAALPLLGLFHAVLAIDWPPFTKITRLLDGTLWPMMRNAGVLELLLVASLAGLGEEMFFRGVVQAFLSTKIGTPLALLVASVIFGACHPVTRTYVVGASVMGAIFGGLFLASGNLLVPVVSHGVYDFLALLLFRRERLYNSRTQNVQDADNEHPTLD